jgi:hypothetical protein
LANQDSDIRPVTLVAALQLARPLVEEMKPTFSWHVLEVQAAVG